MKKLNVLCTCKLPPPSQSVRHCEKIAPSGVACVAIFAPYWPLFETMVQSLQQLKPQFSHCCNVSYENTAHKRQLNWLPDQLALPTSTFIYQVAMLPHSSREILCMFSRLMPSIPGIGFRIHSNQTRIKQARKLSE